jgi:hypothetical protein
VLAGLAFVASAAASSGSFTLQIFQGYNFGSSEVVKSGTPTADLNFTYQTRRIGMISYLGAEKIKFFPVAPAPGSISAADVAKWEDYVAGPGPGYYVLRAHSNGQLYLVQLVSFENQGRAASFWRMRFNRQEFASGGNAAKIHRLGFQESGEQRRAAVAFARGPAIRERQRQRVFQVAVNQDVVIGPEA